MKHSGFGPPKQFGAAMNFDLVAYRPFQAKKCLKRCDVWWVDDLRLPSGSAIGIPRSCSLLRVPPHRTWRCMYSRSRGIGRRQQGRACDDSQSDLRWTRKVASRNQLLEVRKISSPHGYDFLTP